MIVRNVFFLALLLALACGPGNRGVEEPDPETLRQELTPTRVQVAVARHKPFEYRLQANGRVVARHQTTLTCQVSGTLRQLHIRPGQQVSRGQVLAGISNPALELELEKARIQLRERELEYQSQLLAVGNRGDSAAWQEIRQNLAYISGLEAARLQYRQARLALDRTRITAPFSGRIARLHTTLGATLKPGDELATLYDPASLVVEARVLEAALEHVRPGMPATLTPLAGSKPFKATLLDMEARVDKHGTLGIALQAARPDRLLPGMHVAVTLLSPRNRNLVVPARAVVIRSGRQVVFVARQGLAKWHYVTTGLQNDTEVEILEGLQPGDTVIISNNLYLAHDSPVTIATPQP